MQTEKLVFAQSVEALFVRALGPRLTRDGRLRLKDVGLDLGEPLRPAYTLEAWKAFLRVAAQDVFPAEAPDGSYFGLGMRYHQGLRQTAVGRASMALVTRLGPRRTLERVPHHVRAGNNFNEVRVEEVKVDSATLWMKDVTADNPFFACGFLSETLCSAGASDVRVEPVAFDGTSATFHLTWGNMVSGVMAVSADAG
ncbi:TIGR02265 family protein [Myxococcaceae bacterium GXIMD 01537]